MISTQPGSTPLASFKVLSLELVESSETSPCHAVGNDIGEVIDIYMYITVVCMSFMCMFVYVHTCLHVHLCVSM